MEPWLAALLALAALAAGFALGRATAGGRSPAPAAEGQRGRKPSVVERIRRGFYSPDKERKLSSMLKISLVPGEREWTIPALAKEVGDISGDPEIRAMAANRLADFGAEAASALSELRAALRDKSPLVRNSAIVACGEIGVANSELAETLEKLLSHQSPETRIAAAVALAKIGSPPAKALEALFDVLENEADFGWSARLEVAGVIAKAAPEQAPRAAPILLLALAHDNQATRRKAAEAMLRFGEAMAGPLRHALEHPWEDVRRGAAAVIGQLGEAGREALREALRHKDPVMRREAVQGIGSSTSGDRVERAERLVPLLADDDAGVRDAASRALRGLGPSTTRVLVDSIAERGEFLRKPIYDILRGWGDAAFPELRKILERGEAPERREVAASLIALRDSNGTATAKLLELAGKDADESVRKEALRASTPSTKGA